MPARTGEQFLKGLRGRRDVWVDGEKIADVVDHPKLRGAAHALAEVYDLHHAEAATCLAPDPETGEPIPVAKAPGSKVTAGTLNQTGGFVMRAEKVGADTLLAQIVQMVASAQRSRAPIQRMADQVAGWFVPVVIVIALLAFGAWLVWGPSPAFAYAIVSAVAVLIIACPCALGLATPMSIMVGVGKGAQHGVLIRDAEALERMEKVDTLVVDKTGTLTQDKIALERHIDVFGTPSNDVLRHAYLNSYYQTGLKNLLDHAVLEHAELQGEMRIAQDYRKVDEIPFDFVR
eukprot:gene53224-71157_t